MKKKKYLKKTLYWGATAEEKIQKVAYKLRKKNVSDSEIVRTAIHLVSVDALLEALTE